MTQRANPTFYPIVILLVVALLIFSPALLKWEPVKMLFGIVPKRPPISNPDVKVWVHQRSGFYYCADSTLYGKISPGDFMPQGEALQAGYRPMGKEPCR